MKRWMLLIAIAAAPGCSRYAAPTLSVARARITEQSPRGVVVAFVLEARNVNEVELPLREMQYSLSLDGREVFRGVRSPEATLSRLGTQRITIPAVIPTSDPMPRGVVPYTLQGRLAYTVPGQISQILFDTNVRRPEVRFSEHGTIDLSAPPVPPAPEHAAAPPKPAP